MMTTEELLNAEDEHGPTHVGNPDGHSNTAHAAHAAAKEMLDMWTGWFNEGLSVEAFRSDMKALHKNSFNQSKPNITLPT